MSEQFCVIDPITIAGAVLTSNNVPENDYPPHNMGTTYALNDLVIVVADHLIYKSLQPANTGHLPSGSIGVWWSVVGSTNANAMFDGKVSTQTSNANSIVVGGRKFVLAVLVLVSATYLVWAGRIADGVYSAVVIATVTAYITGNVYQKATSAAPKPA